MDRREANEAKARSRGISRDMSPEAIARRIDIISQLRAFSQLLGQAEKIDGMESDGDAEKEAGTEDRSSV